MWAFATVGQSNGQVFMILGMVAERWVGEFSAQELAKMAWAFATASQTHVALFVMWARAAARRAGELNEQNISNMAWACAAVSESDAALFVALATVAEGRVSNFNSQDFANTLWAFAMTRCILPLFVTLVREAEWRAGDLKSQELSNTAWAIAAAAWSDMPLLAVVATATRRALRGFKQDQLRTTFWALSRHESLVEVWSLFEHAMFAGHCFSLRCYGALLMESEQRELLDRETALLRGLEGVPASTSTTMGYITATKRVAAMHFVEMTEIEWTDCGWRYVEDQFLGEASLLGNWHACSRQSPPSSLDFWQGQNATAPLAPCSQAWHLLAHVSAMARTGDPAYVCKPVEDFGLEALDLSE